MFTGIIETTGKILRVSPIDSGIEFEVVTDFNHPDLKIGDSVAISGACMTVTNLKEKGNIFEFYTSFKSLELTNLSRLKEGSLVNLERAMAVGQRFGGHMVQGHVDGLGKVLSRTVIEENKVEEFWIEPPPELTKYFVKKGSVTVDGVSLTVVDVKDGCFQLVLIPETIHKTNANQWNKDVLVNLEVDVLAKYIENFLELRFSK
jgi:riboflavin synthase